MLQQLRYGRGLDNRRLKAAGYRFRATTRETVQAFAEHQRVRGLRDGEGEGYQYEREVEEFLRWSPAVRGDDGLGLGPPEPRSARGAGARARGVARRRGPRAWRRAARRPEPRRHVGTGSPSSSGGAADSELAADP